MLEDFQVLSEQLSVIGQAVDLMQRAADADAISDEACVAIGAFIGREFEKLGIGPPCPYCDGTGKEPTGDEGDK
jgi:hypothetical protein